MVELWKLKISKNMKKILYILLFCSQVSLGQTLELVKDINTIQYSNILNSSAKINGFLYFASLTNDKYSLWKTDGTTAGTVQVLTELTDVIFKNIFQATPTKFYAEVINAGVNQLWITDGTVAGTTNLLNISTLIGYPQTMIGNIFYFIHKPPAATNFQLWKTDGTVSGTTMVSDFGFTTGFFNIYGITNLNGSLLISTTYISGSSLWLSNGTAAGTTKIVDINTNYTRVPIKFGVLGTKAYFINDDAANGQELWETDGTAAGTHLFVDILAGTGSSLPIESTYTNCNGLLFFVAKNGSLYKLFKTDGTVSGTVALSDGTNTQFASSDNGCFCANTSLYFRSSTVATGMELSKTDGTLAGTSFIKDINVGTGDSYPTDFQYINGKTFFMARTAANGREMYTTDGTTANTNIITELLPGVSDGVGFKGLGNWDINNKLVFSGYFSTTGSNKPFISDGTAAGTQLLKDLATVTTGSNPYDLTKIGNRIYFSASSNSGVYSTHNHNPYFTDGTIAGTQILKDFLVGYYPYNYGFQFENIDNTNFYFSNGGHLLCKSDGTDAGTSVVDATAIYGDFGALGNAAIFNKSDATNGNELWKNENGVSTFLKDIYTGIGGSYPNNFFKHNNQMFFYANNALYGKEIWKTDGTAAGTTLLKDMNPGTEWSYIDDIKPISFNGNFYTFLTTTNNGLTLSLIKSDGTTANTSSIRDFSQLTYHSFGYRIDINSKLFIFNNELYFTIINCDNYLSHLELWKTDGTAAGTILVKIISPDVVTVLSDLRGLSSVLNVFSFFTKGSKFYFYAHSYRFVSNSEEYFTTKLWISDGTAAGTTELATAVVDFEKNHSYFFEDKNYIFNISATEIGFVFFDAAHGQEIWKTDGTVANTQFFYDIYPGTKGSFADSFTELNGYSYFDADNSINGNELLRFNQILQIFETITTSGNWSANGTWNTNSPPAAINTAKINATHTVNIPNAGNQVKTIIMNGGTINLNGGTLEIKNQ
jgi:ELWxxDGT repeat protein